MIALIVIDMQVGLFTDQGPRFDETGVVQRTNELAEAMRAAGGIVVFVQHDGPPGTLFAPGTPGWAILPSLEQHEGDLVVHKRTNDAFHETGLQSVLEKNAVAELVVTGCATEFCVDSTIRAAVSRNFEVTIVSDGHTTADRPHLKAEQIIEHHNYVWSELITRRRVNVTPASEIRVSNGG